MTEQRIEYFKNRYDRRPTIRIAVGYALRQWLTYAVAAVPEPREHLHRANHTVLSVLRQNESDRRLFWLGIYFSIELGHFDKANEMLDAAYTYRSFYKNNYPFDYKVLLFLYAYLEIKQKRAKSAKKHMRTLEASSKNPDFDHLLMLGMLHLAFYEYDDAYRCLQYSFELGCRSVFLFNALFTYYRTAAKTPKVMTIKESKLLLLTVNWAINHSANVEDIIAVYQDELLKGGQIDLAEHIYRQFPNQWILKELCVHYMSIPDYGPVAHSYYRDAERRQVYIPNLSYYLVRAAFENGSERIHHYTMAQYLRKPDGDVDLLVYVYHLLLTDPSLSDLAESKVSEILQMAALCLQSGIRGRHANSLYYFFWIKCNETQITGKNVDRAEEILREEMCKFEIADPKGTVRYLYVNEWEKLGITEYKFPEDGTPLVIEAVGSGFRYTGLSEGRARVLDTRLEIRRRVASAGVALYRHFYDNGLQSFEVIAYLVKSQESCDKTLKAVLESPVASKAFKTQCSVALGRLNYDKGKLDLALDYYGKADEDSLDDALLEHMLTAYIKQKVYPDAAGLIARKWRRIDSRVLFNVCKPLAVKKYARHHPAIVNAAYQLLLDSKYDKNLLEVVLNNFEGTQKEWLALSRAISDLSMHEPRLDRLILKNAAWAHHFDEETQRVFVRNANDTDKDFIYYAIYEMIVGKVKPLPETITALEHIYFETQDEKGLLAYGLSFVYLGHDINTAKSDEIILASLLAQEKSGIFFPIFKGSKRVTGTYIEKYRPFMYKTLPGKDVRLYYKVDAEEDWRSLPMEYWRFGLYLARVPHFYNENLTYYFSEELPTGSITTKENEISNKEMHLDDNKNDPFFIINNATIYEQMFRYEQVEEIIGGLVKDIKAVRSRLM